MYHVGHWSKLKNFFILGRSWDCVKVMLDVWCKNNVVPAPKVGVTVAILSGSKPHNSRNCSLKDKI